MKKINLISAMAMLLTSFSAAYAQQPHDARAIKYLKNYQCMKAGKSWTDADYHRWIAKERPFNDPSIPKDPAVYASSDQNAA